MMMFKAIKLGGAPSEDTVGGIFEGERVNLKTLIDKQLGAEEIKAAIVTFSPCARTANRDEIQGRSGTYAARDGRLR